MTFKTWVKKQGGVSVLSRKMEVTRQIIYYWINKSNTPSITNMRKIVKLSQGRLTFADIIRDTSI